MHVVRAALGFVLLVIVLGACPKPPPTGPGQPPGPVQCGTQAVEKCAAQAVPSVNDCLSGMSDIQSCLIGLIRPAGCLTYEVVACVTRHEGDAARAASRENPGDTRDARRAARAKEYLDKQGVTFADGSP
jgi:hypothetical protein